MTEKAKVERWSGAASDLVIEFLPFVVDSFGKFGSVECVEEYYGVGVRILSPPCWDIASALEGGVY